MNNKNILTIFLALVAVAGHAQIAAHALADTYWRNETTGDWVIGVTQNRVIYGNQVWDIVAQTEKKDSYTLTISDGTIIKVGKQKKGLRSMIIGQQKPVVCSPITTSALPDYPTKDVRTGFVDNGYSITDSVTINGWMRNFSQEGVELEIYYDDIITDETESVRVKTDGEGRFSITMPLLNSMEVMLDWGDDDCQTVLEPGKSYFFLHDDKTGQTLWMGDDVRVQNELVAVKINEAKTHVNQSAFGSVDAMKFWALADSVRKVNVAELEKAMKEHPNLSQRFIDFKRDSYQTEQGRDMMQAQFFTNPPFQLPKDYLAYVSREFWQKAVKPYTLHEDFASLMDIFVHFHEPKSGTFFLEKIVQRLQQEGITVNEDPRKIANTLININEMMERLDVLDSLGCDQVIREFSLANTLLGLIEHNNDALDQIAMSYVRKQLHMPAALARVEQQNDKYRLVPQHDLSKSSSLKSADDVAGIIDGKQILSKITEPYRGRLVLLDIWGTWCSPCLEVLSHSKEEYERLKDYDLVYLYLANGSKEDAYINVINRYELAGPNIVHYNLPDKQQNAIEEYLDVHQWPHFRLIDRGGNVLDVDADPRNLDALAGLLEMMK
ncbi:MAG: thioredoxin family protein [Bacteroidaceae bacterium]|nr:thioredoxin family protein [Bacteroidaceae bacterium]